jgi:hypothetical protein
MNAPKQEVVLADQLKYIHFNSDGDIVIPNLVSGILSDWFFETIEAHSNEFSEDVYAGLLRLQETGYVIAAMIAMSRSMSIVSKTASKRLIVHKDDMLATVSILNLCKKTVEALAIKANKSIESLAESSLEELLKANPEGLTIDEAAKRLNMGYKEVRKHLLELVAAEQATVSKSTSGKKGRPSSVFKKVDYS